MMREGWSEQMMRSVVRHFAAFMEVELKKFETVFKIAMRTDLLADLDAKNTVRKLMVKGTTPFDKETGSSPLLEQLILSIVQKLDYNLGQNPIVQQVMFDEQGTILMKER